MEWRSTHQQLITHDSNCPNINLVAVTFLFKQLGWAVKGCATDTELWVVAFIDDSTEPKVRNVSSKIPSSQIEVFEELVLFLFIHSVNFGIWWEVKQDICEFNVTMNNTKLPDVFAAEYNLLKNLAYFELSYRFSQLE